jgi:hypothetical protein
LQGMVAWAHTVAMKRLAVVSIAGALMTLAAACSADSRVWTHPVESKPNLTEFKANSCPGVGYILSFEGNEYIGDVDPDVPPREIPGEIPYLADTHLPDDALDSGYRQGERELWTSESLGKTGVFIVDPTHVERWPRWGGCA